MLKNNNLIYFDNAANSFPKHEVIETFNKVNSEFIANPNSIHFEGQKAFRLLERSREAILNCFKLNKHGVIFVSGASESNNLAIKGYCLKNKNRGNHIITSNVEHPSVLECFKQLKELFGFEITYLECDNNGIVTLSNLKKAIKENTILVSLMAVNNEVGSINPIEEIASYLLNFPKIAFHVDAVQAIGKININYENVDLISYCGHKIGGLNGCGALIKKKNINLLPLISGGGQENGIRSGSNDLANAVCLAKATELCLMNINSNYQKVLSLFLKLDNYIQFHTNDYVSNSNSSNPYIYNFSLKNKKASVVVEALSNKKIMVSSISACHSRKEKGSYVVKNMKKDDVLANNTIRVSFNEDNSIEEVEILINELSNIIKGVKQ